MIISIPDPLHEFVEGQVKSGKFNSADDFVEDLIRSAQIRSAKERLETLLLAGLDSGPPEEFTDSDWEDIHKRVLPNISVTSTK